jgi:hypothetical protein
MGAKMVRSNKKCKPFFTGAKARGTGDWVGGGGSFLSGGANKGVETSMS